VVKEETADRPGKVVGRPAHSREVKLGRVFTQIAWDETRLSYPRSRFHHLYRRYRDRRRLRQAYLLGSLEARLATCGLSVCITRASTYLWFGGDRSRLQSRNRIEDYWEARRAA
jgi:hypothetical protein